MTGRSDTWGSRMNSPASSSDTAIAFGERVNGRYKASLTVTQKPKLPAADELLTESEFKRPRWAGAPRRPVAYQYMAATATMDEAGRPRLRSSEILDRWRNLSLNLVPVHGAYSLADISVGRASGPDHRS